jgi:hypothetical protein
MIQCNRCKNFKPDVKLFRIKNEHVDMFQTLCSNCEDDYEERRFIVEREYKISDSDVPSKWVSVETDLPVDSRVVWAYDKRRGIVIIAWRRWISPEKGS